MGRIIRFRGAWRFKVFRWSCAPRRQPLVFPSRMQIRYRTDRRRLIGLLVNASFIDVSVGVVADAASQCFNALLA